MLSTADRVMSPEPVCRWAHKSSFSVNMCNFQTQWVTSRLVYTRSQCKPAAGDIWKSLTNANIIFIVYFDLSYQYMVHLFIYPSIHPSLFNPIKSNHFM